MKTIKFRKSLSKSILQGEKKTTWRLFDDKDLSLGDIVSFLVWETNEEFAKAKLIYVKEKRFCELVDEDWEGHDKFLSDKVMYETFSKYYGRQVDKDSLIKIIKFELQ